MRISAARVGETTLNRERLYELLGERLRSERSRVDWNQAELARRLDLSRTSITNIECGRQGIYVHQLMELALVLEVSPCDLLPALDDVTKRPSEDYPTELLELVSRLKLRTS